MIGNDMDKLYHELDFILEKVDFESIWKGFSKFEFALYDDKQVYFKTNRIPWDNRFLGNTCIDYEGGIIAIWNVTNPAEEDTELLASDLVHEMFHAFQKSKGESRFSNDLIMLDYPDKIENYQVKHLENLFLSRAYLAEDMEEKKTLLARFIAARKYRSHFIGAMITQEHYTETIEGMAEYAGSVALKQISAEKYHDRMGKYISTLEQINENFFHHRRMLYFSGTIFCILLGETGIDLYHQIGETETSLFDLFSGSIREEEFSPDDHDHDILSSLVDQHIKEKKAKFDDFLQLHKEVITEDFVICGYDPVNMLKMDNRILCSHFIMLTNDRHPTPLFLKGPVMLYLEENSHNRVNGIRH